jgi:hypothetical protein
MNTYIDLGINHILDINGYDHILFVLVLCATYQIHQWKTVLILVTAFTIGHCITLALAGLDLVSFNPNIIEMLIPATIIITGLVNILVKINKNDKLPGWKYILPLIFGLIHGLGFSNFFKALMSKASEVVKPLFLFNIGVEIGQIVIVAIALILSYVFLKLLKINPKIWNLVVSGSAMIVATYLLLQRI